MLRPLRLIAAVLAVSATLLPPAAAAEVMDRVVAVVNHEAIPLSELNRRWLATHGVEGAPATRGALLTRLIEVSLEKQRAADLGIAPGPTEVDDTVSGIMADNGIPSLDALSAALAQDGRSLAEFRDEITTQITLFRLVQREVSARIRLTEQALREYYDAHPDQFSQPARVHVRQIFVQHPPDDADAARTMATLRARITGRDTFLEAEKGLAGQPGIQVGALGALGRGEMMPELERALFALPEGGVSEPLPLPGGTALFLVDRLEGGAPPPFEAALDRVRERATAAETERRMADWLAALKVNAHIEIRDLGPEPS